MATKPRPREHFTSVPPRLQKTHWTRHYAVHHCRAANTWREKYEYKYVHEKKGRKCNIFLIPLTGRWPLREKKNFRFIPSGSSKIFSNMSENGSVLKHDAFLFKSRCRKEMKSEECFCILRCGKLHDFACHPAILEMFVYSFKKRNDEHNDWLFHLERCSATVHAKYRIRF